jgi:hypothetical protein
VDISMLPQGMYLATVSGKNGGSIPVKIIKK